MKKAVKVTAAIAAFSFLSAACTHHVNVTSAPPGADLVVENRQIGKTPCVFKERTGTGKIYQFRVTKEGYKELVVLHQQNQVNTGLKTFAIVGGILLLFPAIAGAYKWEPPDNLHFELQEEPSTGSVAREGK